MYSSAHLHVTCFRTARSNSVVVDVVEQAFDVKL